MSRTGCLLFLALGCVFQTSPTEEATDPGMLTECAGVDAVDDTHVAFAMVDCTDDTADIAAVLAGWSSSGGALFMQETAAIEQWSEEHPLPTKSRDACGVEEALAETIEDLTVDVRDWAPGQASVFGCDAHLADDTWMTYAVFTVDADDPTVTDCLAFGHDPQGLVDGSYSASGVRFGVDPSFDLSECGVAVW